MGGQEEAATDLIERQGTSGNQDLKDHTKSTSSKALGARAGAEGEAGAGAGAGGAESPDCLLPPDLVEKAEKELGETPSVRTAALLELRSKLEGLPAEDRPHRLDDQYLLAFLRPQKFRVDTAFQKMKAYTAFKKERKEALLGMKVGSFKDISDLDFMRTLVKKDQQGRVIICLFPSRLGPIKDPDIFLLWNVFWLESTGLMFDPYMQVNGVVILEDLAGFNMSHLMVALQGPMRRASDANMRFMRQACPYRLGGIYLLNEPIFVDVIQSMMRVVTPRKIMERIRLLGRKEQGIAELHKLISPECLPTDFGGTSDEKPDAWFVNAEKMEAEGTLVPLF